MHCILAPTPAQTATKEGAGTIPARTHIDTHELESVVSLVDRVLVDFDVVELLTDLTRCCAQIFGIEAGLLLADPYQQLYLMATSSERSSTVELFRSQVQQGPCQDCYVSGDAVGIADLSSAPGRWPRFTAAALEAGFPSAHALPVRGAGTVLGALGLISSHAVEPDESELAIAQTLARIAGMAVIRQRGPNLTTVMSHLHAALTGRIAVERAKGFLCGTLDVTDDEAFTLLQIYSRTHSEYLSDVARRLVTDRYVRPRLIAAFTELVGTPP